MTGNELRFVNYFSGYRKVNGQPRRDEMAPSESGITDDDRAFLSANADALANSPRKFMLDHPDLIRRMIKETESFGEVSITERLYCIVNGITERPTAPFKSFFVGYGGVRKEVSNPELLRHAALVGSNDPAHGGKVKAFLARNRDRDASLYDLPDDQEGVSFVVCPVLGVRTLNIKRPYVEGVLLMSWEEFRNKFPDAPVTCSGHAKRISQALAEEVSPGVTRHAASVVKATVSRATVGDDGLSVNQRKGKKTRDTHMSKVDENGLNGYQRIAIAARPKQRRTMANKGMCSLPENERLWRMYRNFVDWLSQKYRDDVLEGRPTGRCGTEGAYHVDHIYSVIEGFNKGVSPWVIADRSNLQCVRWEENSAKQAKSERSLSDTIEMAKYTFEKSSREYAHFIKVANQHIADDFVSSGSLYETFMTVVNDTEFQKKQQV